MARNMMQCVIFVKHFFTKKIVFSEIFNTPGRQGDDVAVRNPFIAIVNAKWYQGCYLRLDSYQFSLVQIAQNIFGHLCKALTIKHLQRLESNSTFCIFMIPACPGWVSVNLISAVLTVAAE